MSAAKVLKKHELTLAGKKRMVAPAPTAPERPEAPVQAKILSQENGQVLLQVVCSCGREIRLRCATGGTAG